MPAIIQMLVRKLAVKCANLATSVSAKTLHLLVCLQTIHAGLVTNAPLVLQKDLSTITKINGGSAISIRALQATGVRTVFPHLALLEHLILSMAVMILLTA